MPATKAVQQMIDTVSSYLGFSLKCKPSEFFHHPLRGFEENLFHTDGFRTYFGFMLCRTDGFGAD
jgi:hypothetical protein